MITIPVQINGKLRDELVVEKDTLEETIKEQALSQENVKKYIVDDYRIGQLCKSIPGINFDQEITTCYEDIKACFFLNFSINI